MQNVLKLTMSRSKVVSLLNEITLSGRKEILGYVLITASVCKYLIAEFRLTSVYLPDITAVLQDLLL